MRGQGLGLVLGFTVRVYGLGCDLGLLGLLRVKSYFYSRGLGFSVDGENPAPHGILINQVLSNVPGVLGVLGSPYKDHTG